MDFSKVADYVKKHAGIFTVLGLAVLFYFIFFFNIGNYALMDVDETRYVSMARDMFNTKDFMTLYLNGEFFFEKPPLFFWLECFLLHYSERLMNLLQDFRYLCAGH